MKAVILAGGLGTRIAEETSIKPKPMIEIGGKPILWHIMKIYSSYGINEFIICCGYKGYIIKEYFANYFLHMSDVTFDMSKNRMEVHSERAEKWKVTLIDTGENTMTGGRLKRIEPYLDEETFCLTYGDGLASVDINKTIEFHKNHGKQATLVATLPPGRFGSLKFNHNRVERFEEKPKGDGSYINGGFFVLNRSVISRIKDDSCVWEQEPLQSLAQDGEMMAYKHDGFWQPMDTLREKQKLELLWETNKAPWKVW